MTYRKNVMLVSAESFKSKDGRVFNKVEILDLNKMTGRAESSVQFADELPELCATGKAGFGDIVTAEFEIEGLTSKPKFKGITKVVQKSVMPVELGDEAK